MTETFNGGYTKALQDVVNFFLNHSEDLKYNHMYNQKGIHNVLQALLANRAELRETGTVDNLVIDKTTKEVRKTHDIW